MTPTIENLTYKMPNAVNEKKVGYYNQADGYNDGYFWDELLEYRVRCRAQPNDEEEEILYCFKNYESAFTFYKKTPTAHELNALVMQKEHIISIRRNEFIHVKTPRTVEWPAHFLMRPQGSATFIELFMALATQKQKIAFLQQFVAG